MIFSAALIFGAGTLFFGAAFACPVCAIIAKAFRRRASRFSCFCVCASVSVSFFAFYVVRFFRSFPPNVFFSQNVRFLFFAFLIGFLISALWKFLLIPVAVFYCFVWWYSVSFLRSTFPECTTFGEQALFLDVLTSETEKNATSIFVCRVSDFFPFPVRRFWFSSKKIEPSSLQNRVFSFYPLEIFEKEVLLPKVENLPARYKIEFLQTENDFEIKANQTL